VVNPEKCSGCDLCGMYCPDFAIHGHKVAAPAAKEVDRES
jgi:Pyruvate/2-oxoacid:ferredoxin oxidoreductase delta subunit